MILLTVACDFFLPGQPINPEPLPTHGILMPTWEEDDFEMVCRRLLKIGSGWLRRARKDPRTEYLWTKGEETRAVILVDQVRLWRHPRGTAFLRLIDGDPKRFAFVTDPDE